MKGLWGFVGFLDVEVCFVSGVDWLVVIGWLRVFICGCGGVVCEDWGLSGKFLRFLYSFVKFIFRVFMNCFLLFVWLISNCMGFFGGVGIW